MFDEQQQTLIDPCLDEFCDSLQGFLIRQMDGIIILKNGAQVSKVGTTRDSPNKSQDLSPYTIQYYYKSGATVDGDILSEVVTEMFSTMSISESTD